MGRPVFGPFFDWNNFGEDNIRRVVNQKSEFYPYNVSVEKDARDKPVKYTVEVALAGIKKEEISVSITDEGGLNIKVTPDRKVNEKVIILRNNISYAKKDITFEIPKEVNLKGITSKYVDGLLTVEVPLIVEKSKSRNISIG